ncbi:hypothetical protein PV328_009347 [Microctonus aethiopoides]|uniref:Uncharacterized protein n=1 Tax=Microctonus aethiopoides TaxID=144406 RepID=A0AA39C5M4_9HYME|nr:hypothetical protein PV328_009347 [Microctonus aethiopoides]
MLMIKTMRGPVMLLILFLFYHGSNADTRYYIELKNDDVTNIMPSDRMINDNKDENSQAIFNLHDESMIHDTLKANHERRNSFHETSTFDPDVLNKFLDEYANKMKSTTERSVYAYPFHITTKQPTITSVEIVDNSNVDAATTSSTEESVTINGAEISLENIKAPNDTNKRNKYYNANSNDDRNGGWVTLEAIPWSKSKISKWQANPSSQQSWPDTKWDKPMSGKPHSSEHSSRPYYENNKPWYDKPKPHWTEYQFDRPKPISSTRPSISNNRYETNSNQAEKWPPEKPDHSSWNDFSRPNSDIITDDRPSNFPTNNWDRYDQTSRPSSFNDRYSDQHYGASNSWPGTNYPHDKYEHVQEKPSFMKPNHQRPFYSGQYEYESHYRPSHPAQGDGEWVLLSTNRGYSKSRQRSIQFDNSHESPINPLNGTAGKVTKAKGTDSTIPVMTSKRQVGRI